MSLLVQSVSYLVTMLATGLWHGANWTFVTWGLRFWHLYDWRDNSGTLFLRPAGSVQWQNMAIIWLSMCNPLRLPVTVAWVFFRSNTLTDAFQMIRRAVSISVVPELSWWVAILTPIFIAC